MTSQETSRLTLSLSFSFRGETHTPRTTVDLDAWMATHDRLPSFYDHLAEANDIDPYSHEYDVMMMDELVYEHAEGLAARFLHNGDFDGEGFEAAWHEMRLDQTLQAIAVRHMGVKDLVGHPQLRHALADAYRQGAAHAVDTPAATIGSTTPPAF